MYLVKMTKNDEVRQDDQQNGRFGQESPPPPSPSPNTSPSHLSGRRGSPEKGVKVL